MRLDHQLEGRPLGTITTKDGTEIFYKDWGTGQPIVFHHGWPLSADDWDNQMLFFGAAMEGRRRRTRATRWTPMPPGLSHLVC
jgi:pimeloyl-ACP methyl ester carboxylesterase